jgi:serine/threonine-protein kinase
MLFQMLAGVLPFRGESMAELMYKIANEAAPDIRIVRPELPETLAVVVARSMSKLSETRYQDGDEFAVDLRRVLVDLATTPMAASAPVSSSATPVSEQTIAFSATAPARQIDFEATAVQSAKNPGLEKDAGRADIEI